MINWQIQTNQDRIRSGMLNCIKLFFIFRRTIFEISIKNILMTQIYSLWKFYDTLPYLFTLVKYKLSQLCCTDKPKQFFKIFADCYLSCLNVHVVREIIKCFCIYLSCENKRQIFSARASRAKNNNDDLSFFLFL